MAAPIFVRMVLRFAEAETWLGGEALSENTSGLAGVDLPPVVVASMSVPVVLEDRSVLVDRLVLVDMGLPVVLVGMQVVLVVVGRMLMEVAAVESTWVPAVVANIRVVVAVHRRMVVGAPVENILLSAVAAAAAAVVVVVEEELDASTTDLAVARRSY